MKVALGCFRHVHRQHRGLESHRRAIKEVCGAEKFFVRWKGAIRNHPFRSRRAFGHPELLRWRGEVESWHSLKRHLADEAVTPSSNEELSLSVRNS